MKMTDEACGLLGPSFSTPEELKAIGGLGSICPACSFHKRGDGGLWGQRAYHFCSLLICFPARRPVDGWLRIQGLKPGHFSQRGFLIDS